MSENIDLKISAKKLTSKGLENVSEANLLAIASKISVTVRKRKKED